MTESTKQTVFIGAFLVPYLIWGAIFAFILGVV